MKKLKNLPQWVRVIMGGAGILLGAAVSFATVGLDGVGLLFLLPFAAFFIWLCPELWRGE